MLNILFVAGKRIIPRVLNKKTKKVPGWNQFVKSCFRDSLFWHDIWVQNGRPEQGVVAEVRRNARRKYHNAIKEVHRN